MKAKSFSLLVVLLTVNLAALGCGGTSNVDLGDGSIGNLVWGTMNFGYIDEDLDKALVYANAAIDRYGDEARAQQASLTDFPATDPPEETYRYKALNNIAAVTVAKGDILFKQGDLEGAKAHFQTVIDDYGYAQIQDKEGWAVGASHDSEDFIKVADWAKKRMAAAEKGVYDLDR